MTVVDLRVSSGGISLAVTVAGPGGHEGDDGGRSPVVLLHGFPDSGRLWRHQVPALVAAGHRVIVPDLRGCGSSDKPAELGAYGLAHLVGDVVALLDSVGAPKAHLVGHDWGSVLAWVTAAAAPARVDRLVALSVGHPQAFREAGFEQREKSWYMLLFQFPRVAERWLSSNDWANFRRWARHPDVDDVIADIEADGSLTSALGWYRANLAPETWLDGGVAVPPVAAPTLGIWSSGDIALTEAQMTGSEAYVTGPWRYERIDGAGHWMQLEQPEVINCLLVDFLAGR